MLLIALHGRAGAGKDEAFKVIERWAHTHYRTAVRRAFADPLKLSAFRIFKPDATLEEAIEWANDFKSSGRVIVLEKRPEPHPEVEGCPDEIVDDLMVSMTGREFLQNYGTESHRDVFGPNFWVNHLLPIKNGPLAEKFDNADIGVITDLRFPNEAERVNLVGGEVWWIDRPEREQGDSHASEQHLDERLIHRTIRNHGTLAHFEEMVERTIESYFKYGKVAR
jgi:hypothetical protein